ncbi:hypothetical protein F5148DRAFT_1175117 [Russula earlei]|uniref:Uncharacterized protein n=1 Tax=Russula earlei TaxID=71964 RepID=A0ACC0UHI8_9AGAM|nr:hypothetical protein F5148DRAFT_1175117 [Russula earlei]
MSTQSPPLTRKSTTGPSQGLSSSPRENSPSPSFRERQRNTRGQSTSGFQGSYNGQQSPTTSSTSFHQRRTPPLAAQTVSGQIRRATSPLYHSTSRDGSPDQVTLPPAPIHHTGQQTITHQMPSQSSHNHSPSNLLQLNANQMTPSMGFARPVPRPAPPQFMSLDIIDQAHSLGSLGAGMAGVAYAGGASSGPVSRSTQFEPNSLPKESNLERARNGERPSPRDPASGPTVAQRRDTARDKDRESWERDREQQRRRGSIKRDPSSAMPIQQPSPKLEVPRADSPQYFSALSTPGEPSPSFGQHERELRTAQAAALPPSPPAPRQNVPYTEPLRSTPPSVAKLATQSPTGQSVKARTPDKSLPVQEEPEEEGAYELHGQQEQERDKWTPGGSEFGRHPLRHEQEARDLERQHHATSSPTPSSDLLPEGFDPRYDARHERNGRETSGQKSLKNSDEVTQKRDGDEEEDIQHSGHTQSQDEESYTPRSPSVTLPPERGHGTRDSPGPSLQRQHPQQSQPQPPRIRSRNGVTDGLGLHSFDAVTFGHTLEQLKSPLPEQNLRPYPAPQVNSSRQINSPHQIHSPSHEEPDHFLDDPVVAAAYYHGYPQSPMATHSRPGAPIPPTPRSHTAAPSPSPLISGMDRANGVKPVLHPYSPAPLAGSPYPYPYGHIRRGQTYSGSYNGTMDLSQMDPNVVREQLALQMQIYALNNNGMASDSTLSPSSTPFPGPQYNPWAFLQTSHAFGGRRGGIPDSTASIRSSPSHQPVALPPHIRPGRGLNHHERSQDLRRRPKIRPPPRVESTQPRDTSPELSSGEETAGESKVGEHRSEPRRYAPRPARWDTSADDEDEADGDDGEWFDEDVGTEGVTDDLLQLEFHTDYVSNPEKRRRRWKIRWEALLRAFHALDCETDTTLVLLAAPSHTGKLHSVASRAIRRDVELLDSSDMIKIRSAFAEVAGRRRTSRSESLLEQLSRASSSSRDGSPSSSSDAREEDLRRALDTAIGSLRALGSLYEQREMRWIEEKNRLDEDKDKVDLLLKQVLGAGVLETGL